MLGYWQRPDATDEIIKDGAAPSAVMDERFLRNRIDRKRYRSWCRVLTFYPNEIEDVVMRLRVLEVAAIGVPSRQQQGGGEDFVVKKR